MPAPATISARFGQDGPHWSTAHTGTDFAAPEGTQVFAASGGVVQAVVDEVQGHPFGTFVTVLHHDSLVTVYAHLTETHVARGQQLATGDPIGAVGSSGNSTGPHLHFEVRPQIGGRHLPVDPEPYLAQAALPAAAPASVPDPDCLPGAGGAPAPGELPELAHTMAPTIARLLEDCPELPAEWVHAQVMAESSWDPGAWSEDANGGAAGLYQIGHPVWTSVEGATGSWARGTRPPADHPVWEPAVHLRVGISHVCTNLRAMTTHLEAHPDKPISPLEASAVCHVAGCSRVTQSAAGIPTPGEAGCGDQCVDTIHTYLAHIHRHTAGFSADAPPSGED